ncbi:MAG: hypothetical protein ACOVOR_05010 [Rhabdochlamydiaceae bacterium]
MISLIPDFQTSFEVLYALNNIHTESLEIDFFSFKNESLRKISELLWGLFPLIVFHQTVTPRTNPMNLAGKVIDFSRSYMSPFYKITDMFKFPLKYFVMSIANKVIAISIFKIARATENTITKQNRQFDIDRSNLYPNSILMIEIFFKTISFILIYQMRHHIDPILTNRLILSTTLPFVITKYIHLTTKDSDLALSLEMYQTGLNITWCCFRFIPLFIRG